MAILNSLAGHVSVDSQAYVSVPRSASVYPINKSSLPRLEQSTIRGLDMATYGGPDELHFEALRSVLRERGGVARADDLARLMEDQRCGDFVTLAKLIVSGDVFGFDWRNKFWIPMLQFELRDLTLKPAPRRVVSELGAVFDGWALAVWFVRPNSWLDERSPVDLLDSDLPAVLDAARADRFVVGG